jgi:alpha-glucosidase
MALALAFATACNDAPASVTPNADVTADAAGDAPADAVDVAVDVADTSAQPDATDATDAAPDTSLDSSPDSSPDVAPDVPSPPPWAHCEGTDAHTAGGGDVVAVCGSAEVAVRATTAGVRVEGRAFGAAPGLSRVVEPGGEGDALPAFVTGAGAVEWCAETWRAVLEPATCVVALRDAEGRELQATAQAPVPDADGVRWALREGGGRRWRGCGENTGPLERRGTAMTYWNTDAYDSAWGGYAPGASPLYLSLPLCWALDDTGTASGFWVDHTWRLAIDLAATSADAIGLQGEGPSVAVWLLPGPAPDSVLDRYSRLAGRPHMPPRWALGFHQSRWGYPDEAAFDALAAEFRARRLPADVLYFDIQHMRGFRTFTWEPDRFPDPAALLGRLRARGFRTVAIADPGIKVDPDWLVFARAESQGHFLRWPSGELFVGRAWPGDSAFPDYSDPDASAWWSTETGLLAGLGVSGVWNDVNEPTTFPEGGGGNTVPNELSAHGEGRATTMAELHNVYGSLMARATFRGLERARPNERPFVLSRAGFSGLQRWAGVWTGDVPSTWHGLAETLPMMVNVGASGVPMVGSDVGGYSGGATPELYARWFALGFLSPFFRAHVTNGVAGQEPWVFGTEVEDIARGLLEERSRLRPYLYSLAWEAAQTGTPMLRPVEWHFADYPADASERHAMLGPWLFVSPVLREGATEHTVVLPAGRFFEYASDAAYDGPVELTTAAPLAALPLFVREGAILPRWDAMQHEGEREAGVLYLDVWPGETPTSFELLDDDGLAPLADGRWAVTRLERSQTESSLAVRAARSGAYVPAYRTVELRFARVEQAPTSVTLDGGALREAADLAALRGGGPGWFWDANERALRVRFAASATWNVVAQVDPRVLELRPPVEVELAVRVPEGTPAGAAIYVAGTFNEWTHELLGLAGGDGVARGTIEVPRGEWYFWKFTRGSWETVEKYPACEEARDRYALGRAGSRLETVWAWRDVCEAG